MKSCGSSEKPNEERAVSPSGPRKGIPPPKPRGGPKGFPKDKFSAKKEETAYRKDGYPEGGREI